jgi:hypothetical protein
VSGQMNLLAQPSEEKLEVPVCPAVLNFGSRAGRKHGTLEPLFHHLHIPRRPAKLASDEHWLVALYFAEEVHRYDQSAQAVLQLDAKVSRSPGGRRSFDEPRLWHDSRGIEVDDTLVSWAHLLAGRAEQREIEPDVARARDLAEAYHLLDYFGRVYDQFSHREDWSPVPLIRRLAEEARGLGGDPTQLPLHTEYMREGIADDTRFQQDKEEISCA